MTFSRFQVATNTAYQLIGKFFSGLASLLTISILSSHYDKAGIGEIIIILNYLNIFYLIADFGMNAIAVKRMIEKPELEKSIFQSLYGLRVVISLGLSLIALLIAYLLPYDAATGTGFSPTFKLGVTLLSLTIVTQSLFMTAVAIFQKDLLFSRSVIASSIGSLVLVICLFLFAHPNTPITLPLVGYLIGGIITAIISFWLLPISGKERFIPKFDIKEWKSLFIGSLPIAATLILNVAYFRNDSFILNLLKSKDDVGIYGLAYKWFDQGVTIPVFIVNALYPVFLRVKAEAPQKLPRVLLMACLASLGFGIALAAFLFIFAPLLIAALSGGKDFSAAVAPLRILAVGLPVFFVSNIFLWLLVTLGKQRYLIFIYGIAMLVNIIGNYLLIPTYSYNAAAALTGISEGIVLVLTMFFGLRALKKGIRD